jgi:hypothetical protein
VAVYRRFIFGRFLKKPQPPAQEDNDGIYNYDIFAIEKKEKELLEKYPDHALKIKKAIDEPDPAQIRKKKEH